MSHAPLSEFDPLDISRLNLKGDKKDEAIECLKQVLENLYLSDSYAEHEMATEWGHEEEFRLKNYLERLLEVLS